eukprot:TRINITY_DN70063_c0_g1_i1.p1 TRINITY_DN70063_c0_g1~~TRINITY_DN70063_c0_g1_i1.p1  ORF type:complete len:405 (+),score=101.16 TRINITY_DN70063_c0_g1_i1:98-1312(+)
MVSYQQKKEERQQFYGVTALLTLGAVGSLVWALYELSNGEQDEVRAARVGEYNTAAERWDNASRDIFAQVGNISIWGWHHSSQPVKLHLATRAYSHLWRDSPSDVLGYRPAWYEFEGPIPLSDSTPGLPGWQALSANLSVEFGGQPPVPFPGPVILSQSVVWHTGNWKQCQFHHHGSLAADKRICTSYRVLRELCFTVRRGRDGRWAPSGGGCVLPLEAPPRAVLSIVPSPRFESDPPGPSQTRLLNVHIAVRSVDDPYLVALNETEGELRFGLTPAQRVTMGVVGLVLAAILGAAAANVVYCYTKGLACYETPEAARERIAQEKLKRHEVTFMGVHEDALEQANVTESAQCNSSLPTALRGSRRSRDKHVRIVDNDADEAGVGVAAPAHFAVASDDIELSNMR